MTAISLYGRLIQHIRIKLGRSAEEIQPAVPESGDEIKVYALFSDRTATEIVASPYKAARPEIDPMTPGNPVVEKSARNGFFSALSHLQTLRWAPYPRYHVVWDFAGNPQNVTNYVGSSAGLAFFIRFLVLFMRFQKRPRTSFSVAATGELSDMTAKAKVNPVNAITVKLQAAFDVLKPGDKIYYPAENNGEISDALRRRAESLGLELRPISSVAEMAKIIKGAGLKLGWFRNEFWLKEALAWLIGFLRQNALILTLVGIFLFLLCLFICPRRCPDYEEALRFIEWGEFSRVPLVCLQEAENPGMRRLAQQARTPIELTSSFIYLDDQQPLYQDAGSLSLMQNVTLDSASGYRFEIQTDWPCFFYLLQLEDVASVDLLFPLSSFDLDNHYLKEQQLYLIPGGNDYFFFRSSGTRRLVTLFIFASLWRAKDIEQLCQEYDRSDKPAKKKEYRDKLVVQIQKRNQAIREGWQGLYVKQGFFWRQ